MSKELGFIELHISDTSASSSSSSSSEKEGGKNCHSSTFLQLSYICNADVFANKDCLSDLEN